MVVACGGGFTAVVMEKGDLWSFGKGASNQLGLGTDADQLLLACLGGDDEVRDGEAVVMMAAGYAQAQLAIAFTAPDPQLSFSRHCHCL